MFGGRSAPRATTTRRPPPMMIISAAKGAVRSGKGSESFIYGFLRKPQSAARQQDGRCERRRRRRMLNLALWQHRLQFGRVSDRSRVENQPAKLLESGQVR